MTGDRGNFGSDPQKVEAACWSWPMHSYLWPRGPLMN